LKFGSVIVEIVYILEKNLDWKKKELVKSYSVGKTLDQEDHEFSANSTVHGIKRNSINLKSFKLKLSSVILVYLLYLIVYPDQKKDKISLSYIVAKSCEQTDREIFDIFHHVQPWKG